MLWVLVHQMHSSSSLCSQKVSNLFLGSPERSRMSLSEKRCNARHLQGVCSLALLCRRACTERTGPALLSEVVSGKKNSTEHALHRDGLSSFHSCLW